MRRSEEPYYEKLRTVAKAMDGDTVPLSDVKPPWRVERESKGLRAASLHTRDTLSADGNTLSFIENLRKDEEMSAYPLHADAPHLFLAHELFQIGTQIVGDNIVLH